MRGTLYLTVSAQDQRNQEPVSSSEHLVRVQKGRHTKQDAEDDSCGHRRWVLVQRVDPAPATVGFHHGENCQRSLAKKCVSQRSSKPLINKKKVTHCRIACACCAMAMRLRVSWRMLRCEEMLNEMIRFNTTYRQPCPGKMYTVCIYPRLSALWRVHSVIYNIVRSCRELLMMLRSNLRLGISHFSVTNLLHDTCISQDSLLP